MVKKVIFAQVVTALGTLVVSTVALAAGASSSHSGADSTASARGKPGLPERMSGIRFHCSLERPAKSCGNSIKQVESSSPAWSRATGPVRSPRGDIE